MLKNPICRTCGNLRLPAGQCVVCSKKKLTSEERVARQKSPIPRIEREKKAREMAKIQKSYLKRRALIKTNTEAAKYRRGRLLLALSIDWLLEFPNCFVKLDGEWTLNPACKETLQVLLTAFEIILPETKCVFVKHRMSKLDAEADALRHALFKSMMRMAKDWLSYERSIDDALVSGSISPEAATLMLSDLHQQLLQRPRFSVSTNQPDPRQMTGEL